MRFRVPEIFLGVFLTVAIFAMGIMFDSSHRPPAEQQIAAGAINENASHPPDGGIWNWVTHDAAGFFTLWLVIVGGAQIGLFYWQLRLIRIAADDAKKAGISAERAATATENAVDLSRKTAERQLRAYVLMKTTSFHRPDTEDGDNREWPIHLVFQNSGQTPAYAVAIKAESYLGLRKPIDSIFSLSEAAQISPPSIMAPGARHTMRLGGIEPGHASYLRALKTEQYCYVWGRLDYIDTFGRKHFTKFQMWQGFEGIHQFGFCQVGNGTDDELPEG
jgi:hypothetical protein